MKADEGKEPSVGVPPFAAWLVFAINTGMARSPTPLAAAVFQVNTRAFWNWPESGGIPESARF